MDLSFLQNDHAQLIAELATLALIIVVIHYVIRFFNKRVIERVFAERKNPVARFLKNKQFVFTILTLLHLSIIYQGLNWITGLSGGLLGLIKRVVGAAFVFAILRILTSASNIINEIYNEREIAKYRPIKSYLQGFQIVAYMFGFICIIAILFDRSPLLLLSGLGALTAVILLVFRDTILSLVAGIQLTTNDLIRVGDWIEMPQFNADGDVLEITLHNVKVQNWDKTVTVIPAHKFLENSFKNWRGMWDSGGRRIKRAIYIDVKSIRFLSPEDIEKLSKVHILKDYIESKVKEVEEYNRSMPDQQAVMNLRRLTNVGTFRMYLMHYLKAHPMIRTDMTLLVRQLAPGPQGLPIEIYVFSKDIRWAYYEGIQGDIFDHVFAVMSEFGLNAFQQPSGEDFQKILPKP